MVLDIQVCVLPDQRLLPGPALVEDTAGVKYDVKVVQRRGRTCLLMTETEELSKSQFLVKNQLDFSDVSNLKKLIAGSLQLLKSFSWLTEEYIE